MPETFFYKSKNYKEYKNGSWQCQLLFGNRKSDLRVRVNRCILNNLVVPEQKRDTPQRRQSDDNIDDTADDPWLSAEEERDQIELKQANAAPVDTAYDQ